MLYNQEMTEAEIINKTETSPIRTFESLLEKRVYDDIHGFVYLTNDEKDFLNSPYMKRLHFIKQNALANFIFPGATHTRFSHSIGVLCIVEKMIQKLKTLPKYKINITPFDHQIVRLAALLHDIGHYPLSHTLEDCFMKLDEHCLTMPDKSIDAVTGQIIEGEIKDPSSFFKDIEDAANPTIKTLLKDFPKTPDFKSELHHEKIAKKLVSDMGSPLYGCIGNILKKTYRIIYQEELSEDKINSYLHLIGQLICGEPKYTDNPILLKDKEESDKYFILSLLINSDLDADQMDYMLRDTLNTGIQTTIRIDFLIDNLDICYIQTKNKEIQPVLCFNYKAIESVQQFIFSKAYWYTEIILYDKVCILNRIAKRLYLYSVLTENNIKTKEDFYKNILFNVNKYFSFTDNDFWNKMSILKNNPTTPSLIQEMIKILYGESPIPTNLSLDELSDIKSSSFKTNIQNMQTGENDKNTLYKQINQSFDEKTYFPVFYSSKFFKPTEGEGKNLLYVNRSIYILISPCSHDLICEYNCLKAEELLNSKKLGENVIHRLLNIKGESTENKAFVEKCVVYKFG